jgi:GNAT superfamily N-acetyltransferase
MKAISIQPLTPDRWDDLEKLFGPRGACGGCWCMWWRSNRAEFEARKGEKNRQALKKLVKKGPAPGLIGYLNGEPVGWVCVGPRNGFVRLEKSRVLAPVDNQPAWSVVCFFIAKEARRAGLAVKLLAAAVDYAASQGASIIEGYPVKAYADKMPDAFAYTGLEEIFARAGFEVAARRSKSRAIWRYARRV